MSTRYVIGFDADARAACANISFSPSSRNNNASLARAILAPGGGHRHGRNHVCHRNLFGLTAESLSGAEKVSQGAGRDRRVRQLVGQVHTRPQPGFDNLPRWRSARADRSERRQNTSCLGGTPKRQQRKEEEAHRVRRRTRHVPCMGGTGLVRKASERVRQVVQRVRAQGRALRAR